MRAPARGPLQHVTALQHVTTLGPGPCKRGPGAPPDLVRRGSAVCGAQRRHTEAMSGLEEKRTSLERKIEELRTFEREYRTRLRSYLESHLRDLDSRGSAEPASNNRQNQHAPA